MDCVWYRQTKVLFPTDSRCWFRKQNGNRPWRWVTLLYSRRTCGYIHLVWAELHRAYRALPRWADVHQPSGRPFGHAATPYWPICLIVCLIVFNLALACGSKGLPTENRLGYCSVGKRPVKVRSGYPDVLGNGDHWFVGWPEMVLFLCSFFMVGVRNRGNGCNGVGMAVNR